MIDFIAHSLKREILLSLLLLGIFLAILIFASLRHGIVPAFETLERKESRTTLTRLEQAIDSQFQMLEMFNIEYSSWTDVYESIQQPDIFDEFAAENLFYPEFWTQVNIGMMLFYNLEGQLVWGRMMDPADRKTQLDFKESMKSLTEGDQALALTGSPNTLQGFLETPKGLMMVSAKPILMTDETGPKMGTLAVGRFLTQELIDMFGKSASVEVKFIPVSRPGLPGDIQEAISILSGSLKSSLTVHTSGITYTRKLILDFTGSPLALVEVRKGRFIGKIGTQSINKTMMVMSFAIAMILLIAWYLLGSLIVEPIVSLTAQITEIRQTGDLSNIPSTERKGEIGILAIEFGGLLAELDEAYGDLKKARDQALQMASAKSKFLATMSHEIRTPMNGVLGMAEILQGTDLDHNQQTMVRKIQDSGNHLLAVINDILDFSKIESRNLKLSIEEFNLRVLLEEILDMMDIQASMKNLELMHCFPVTVDQKFIGDPNRISQIMVNLIGNAIKFTDHGRVIVKATVIKDGAGLTNLCVEVSDTGIGISKQQQVKIFKEFSQADDSPARQFQGTGLGLAICKALLHLMDGNIELESEPGKGACFRFELPLRTRQEPLSAPQTLESLQNLRVLIVDAGGPDFDILRQYLTSYGITSSRTDDRSSIPTELNNALADGHPFSLALLDWDMPGNSGLDVARLIRADNDSARLPIVLLSSARPGDERLISSEIYIDKYLTKPVSQSSLSGCLDDLSRKLQKSIKQSDLDTTETASNIIHADVLLIEDNRVNQLVGKTMLEQSGCEVTIAENGVVALAILDDRQFDLIFMDCHMPEMDGFEATALIREKEAATGSHIPIVAITADVVEGVREKCLDAGMDDYITKPFSSLQLQEILLSWLPGKLTGAEPMAGADKAD